MTKPITGLFVPLVTPMYRGSFDAMSMQRLMKSVDQYVDGYVPCLSSGEGAHLSDTLWENAVKTVVRHATKPVYAGIKRQSFGSVLTLARKAKKLGCAGIVIPVPSMDEEKNIRFFMHLSKQIDLPIIVYNTETMSIKTIKGLLQLATIPSVVGIKDSSFDPRVWTKLMRLKQENKIHLSVFQGLENRFEQSKGCDGFFVSLSNTEPALCQEAFHRPSKTVEKKGRKIFWKQNLGGNWFVTLKAILYERGVLRSAEEVGQS